MDDTLRSTSYVIPRLVCLSIKDRYWIGWAFPLYFKTLNVQMRYHLQWVYIKPSRWHTNRYKYIDRSIWDYDGKSLFYIPFSIINERLSEDIILYKERKGIKQRAIGLNNQAFSLINQVYIWRSIYVLMQLSIPLLPHNKGC